jgi:5,10-methylenetetrahydromethanopterin reductase
MNISCSFATSLQTPDHIVLAEQLGFLRAWCYDSPALYPDVWMTLALAAARTSRIGLGPAVLVPSLRHVITNAVAIATLAALAPVRVAVGVGSGFTRRLALGQRPLPWSEVRDYILALRALLRGEEVEWDEADITMLHREGFAPSRPIAVPMLVGAEGPKGLAVARETADGVFTRANPSGFSWVVRNYHGTVLDDGEAPDSERALAAAGHAATLSLHRLYEGSGVEAAPEGREWARQLEAIPERKRHLALHEGHLIGPNALDGAFITGGLLQRLRQTGTAAAHRARLAELKAAGVTEIAYQPAGPDIPRELRAFAAAVGLNPRA